LPWWFEAPSVLGFYALYFKVFDTKLWRLSVCRRVHLVSTPDISGTWNGYVSSSFDANGERYDATMVILQTWTHLDVRLSTRLSESRSIIATISTGYSSGRLLHYEYLNEPRPGAPSTMHIHHGTARVNVSSDNKILEGDYYTGRDRQTFGVLRLIRVQDEGPAMVSAA
jgi:hypothetical protein